MAQNLTFIDRLMLDPKQALGSLARTGVQKAGDIISTPGRALGEAFANSLTPEALLSYDKANRERLMKARGAVASAFGEEPNREISDTSYLFGMAPGFGELMGGLSEYMRQGKKATDQAVVSDNYLGAAGPLVSGALTVLPESEGELFTSALLAPTGLSGANRATSAAGKSIDDIAARRLAASNAKVNQAARTADVTDLPKQGPSLPAVNMNTQRKALEARGIKTERLVDDDVKRLYRKFGTEPVEDAAAKNSRQLYDKIVEERTAGAKASSGSMDTTPVASAKAAATDTVEAAANPSRLRSLLKATGLVGGGVGAGYFLSGNKSGADTAAAITDETTRALAAPMGGAPGGPVEGGAPAAVPQGQSVLDPFQKALEMLPPAEKQNLLQKLGDVLMNTGQALDGRDPRMTQRQLDESRKSPRDRYVQAMLPQLVQMEIQRMNPDPLTQAKIAQLQATTLKEQAMSNPEFYKNLASSIGNGL